MAATLGQRKMSPAEAGAKLLRHADAIRVCVEALAAGHIPGPVRTMQGFRRFAPNFNRVQRGASGAAYNLKWLCENVGSEYSRGQATPWIVGGLQLLVNLERGDWGDTEIERVRRGEHGYTAHALAMQYQKESHARLKYVKRNRNKNPAPAQRKAVGFGHASLS
jgi:hypothetical protein